MVAPPLTQSDAVTSLLSLSITAASSSPIPVSSHSQLGANPSSSSPRQHHTPLTSISNKHHRRLGSTGKTRRRLSDAREACTRPLLASNTAALSLASLSLSASPPSNTTTTSTSTSFGGICKPLAPKPHSNSIHIISGSTPNHLPISLKDGNGFSLLASAAAAGPAVGNAEHNDTTSTTPIPISNGKAGAKKRGIDYKCESCSKVYRHPNCLNKHRWEHTRQWREASKFVLSKHQQVQLLEAATILSFMGKEPTSLPEDRSEWPSFLSGGSLPKVEPVGGGSGTTSSVPSTSTSASSIPSASSLGLSSSSISSTTSTSSLSPFPASASSTPTHSIHPISVSVPNPLSSGPRLHDYALKAPGGKVVVTQVRPGLLLGVNSDGNLSVPYTAGTAAATYPMSMPAQQFTPTRTPHHGYGYDYGYAPVTPVPALGGGPNGNGNPAWSLPNSSMRSASHGRSLSSFSGSVSAQSEDGDIEIDVEEGEENDGKSWYERRGVLMMNGRAGMGMGNGIDLEGDADDMDNDEDDDDDDNDEQYDTHNQGDEHHDNDDEEEGTQIQNHHARYSSRYNAPRTDQIWDGGMDMDIEMDMD